MTNEDSADDRPLGEQRLLALLAQSHQRLLYEMRLKQLKRRLATVTKALKPKPASLPARVAGA
jgi:hypothetical protein